MFLKTIDKSIYKKNTFENLEKYKELWFINNGFISQDKIIDIFYDAYNDREIRFDTLDKFFSNNRQLLLKYLPELHIQLKTIASNELTDLLKNAGLKIVNKNETKQKTKQDSKSKSKEISKSKGDAKSNQSTTPGNFSTNTNEFMNQIFSKNESSGDGNVERESDNLLLVDNDNNSVNETIQKSLIDTIMKITIMKSHSIILEWINHFDILFSNFDYSVGGSINDWINVSQYQKLLEQIDTINKNAEAKAAKIATKWVQEHYSEIAKFVPGAVKGEKGDKGDKGDKGSKGDKGDKGDKGNKGDKPSKDEIKEVILENKGVFKGEKGDKGDKGDIGEFIRKSVGGGEWSKIDKLPLGMNQSRISELKYPEADDDALPLGYLKSDFLDVFVKNGNDLQLTQPTKIKDRKIETFTLSFDLKHPTPRRFLEIKHSVDKIQYFVNSQERLNFTFLSTSSLIRNLSNPGKGSDAATKNYVDIKISKMFMELGFSEKQVLEAQERTEQVYQSTLKKENESDEPKE